MLIMILCNLLDTDILVLATIIMLWCWNPILKLLWEGIKMRQVEQEMNPEKAEWIFQKIFILVLLHFIGCGCVGLMNNAAAEQSF